MNNPFSLEHKSAAITGGSSGIGRAITKLFAASGAKVAIIDLKVESGNTLVEEIKSAGGEATFYSCDVTKQAQVLEVFELIESRNPIDILINNAGIGFVGNLENTSEADFDRLYQVNVKGVYNCLYAGIKGMKARRSGVIINMASTVGSIGIPDRFAYTMTKGAVKTMTFSVALDYVNDGIRCNCISPGRIHTPFVDAFVAKNYPGEEAKMMDYLAKTQPIGRMGKPEEVAHLALYLCSDAASFITGADYHIDGGTINLLP